MCKCNMVENYTKPERKLRMTVIIYADMDDGETAADAEDKLLDSLPRGLDCVSILREEVVDNADT